MSKETTSFVALLRGINVGGNKKVSMEVLRKALEQLGFTNVKTLLNSGNVIFESSEGSADEIKRQIVEKINKTFGFEIDVFIRTKEQIRSLIKSNPFQHVVVTPQTRLYITFLSASAKSSLKIPYETPEKDFQILHIANGEVISVFTVSEKRASTDAMSILEKEFGKNITTRNWNTIVKIARL